MNIDKFNELQKEFSDRLVFVDYNDEYVFIMKDEMDEELSWELEDKNDKEDITFVYGYGDDIINAISVVKLEDINDELEEFIIDSIGHNCYTEEEVF